MKLFCVFLFVFYAYAQATTPLQNEFVGRVASKLGFQEFHLKTEPQATNEVKVVNESIENRNVIADVIEDLLNSFRDVIINGNDALPPLDPLDIPAIGPYSYNVATGVRVQGQVNNFNVEGLRWYVVDYVTFNTLRLQLGLKMTIPWITATGDVEAGARVILVSHTSGFTYRVFINRPEVTVSARLGTNLLAGHLVLRELDINLAIGTIEVTLNGMTGSSLINNVINAAVQNVVQGQLVDELEAISKIVSEQLLEAVNDVLKDYTLADLLG